MSLHEKLNKIEGLTIDTKLKVTFVDGESVIGKYKGYTDAEENDTEKAQIDIETKDGLWYGLEESEIKTIEKI